VFEVQNVCSGGLVITGLKFGLALQMKIGFGYARDSIDRENYMKK
jgi:hypothetical protein